MSVHEVGPSQTAMTMDSSNEGKQRCHIRPRDLGMEMPNGSEMQCIQEKGHPHLKDGCVFGAVDHWVGYGKPPEIEIP